MKKAKILKPLIFWIVYASVTVACVLIDQLTKHFIEIAVANAEGHRIRILGDWLTLVWTTNDGATGGIFSGMKGRNILFFIMTLVGLPVFGYMLYRSRTRSVLGQVAFSFIIGGTIGNAIDRLFLAKNGFFTGEVRDFVRVEGFFGIFNMADSFLVVGVILALLAIVFFDPDSLLSVFLEERKKKKAEELALQSSENADGQAGVEVTNCEAEKTTDIEESKDNASEAEDEKDKSDQ